MKKQFLIGLLVLIVTAGQAQTSALIRGRIVNLPERAKGMMTVDYYSQLQPFFPNKITLQPDSLGRFEVEVPLMDMSPVTIVFHSLMLSPGETYDVEMDGWDIKVSCSGKVSLTNELLDYKPAQYSWHYDEMDDKTDAFVLDAAEKELRRMEAYNDSIARANPRLSPEWRYCAKYRSLASLAQYVVRRHFTAPAVRQQDGRLWQWLHDRFICDLPRPYSIIGDCLDYIIMYYTLELLAPRTGSKYNLSGMETAIDIALEQQDDGTISRTAAFADSLRSLRTMLYDYKALVEAGAADSLLVGHPFEQAVEQCYSDTYFKDLFRNGVVSERLTAQNINRVASLDMPEVVRDYARAVLLYNEVEQYHAPLRPALQALLCEVKDDDFRSLIFERSNYYRDLALLKDADETSLMPNESLAGLAEGKDIFDKIIEPYHGRVVYVDFWGTWCVPCKAYLKYNTHLLHQALIDLPVTYLFLCNGSETEAWRSTIAEYKLTGEHFVHYNLPADQQQAIERYLGICKFPTYIIFDQNGQRVTTEDNEPRPDNPEAVRKKMLELIDK